MEQNLEKKKKVNETVNFLKDNKMYKSFTRVKKKTQNEQWKRETLKLIAEK